MSYKKNPRTFEIVKLKFLCRIMENNVKQQRRKLTAKTKLYWFIFFRGFLSMTKYGLQFPELKFQKCQAANLCDKKQNKTTTKFACLK